MTMSIWSLRWHFTNKSVTGAPYSIKSYSLLHSWTLRWRVRWLKHAVPSWGRGGTAAAVAQNEQTTEEHSTLEQQSPRRLDRPAWCVVWTVWPCGVEVETLRKRRRKATCTSLPVWTGSVLRHCSWTSTSSSVAVTSNFELCAKRQQNKAGNLQQLSVSWSCLVWLPWNGPACILLYYSRVRKKCLAVTAHREL